MVCGYSSNNDSLNYNIVLIKIDNNGNVPVDDIIISNEIEYSLECYPNPVSSNITFSFHIHSAGWRTDNALLNSKDFTGHTHIEIYNVKGQLVKQFSINNDQSSIVWDGKDSNGKQLSNGIYLYKLDTGEKSITKKMVLLR